LPPGKTGFVVLKQAHKSDRPVFWGKEGGKGQLPVDNREEIDWGGDAKGKQEQENLSGNSNFSDTSDAMIEGYPQGQQPFRSRTLKTSSWTGDPRLPCP